MKRPVPGSSGAHPDGLWYLAAASRDVRPGRLMRRFLFGDPLVFGRMKDGAAFALRDVCPHRGAPLSAGRLIAEGGEEVVECPYHGWRFRAADGRCVAAPALPDDRHDAFSIKAAHYRLHEAHGLLWIYRPRSGAPADAPESPPPDIGFAGARGPKTLTVFEVDASFDEAAIGLVDPAHTPFVHRQWWWREGTARRVKEKYFEPTALGFRMPPHPPSSNSRIYGALGGAPLTAIEFRLPALRLEHVTAGKRKILGLTAITPAAEGGIRIVHAMFWDMPVLDLVRPILSGMARDFLAQDSDILASQNENLSSVGHRPLYLGDPDEPARWYMRLKLAWNARHEAGGFQHPIAPATLRWKT